MAVRCGWGVVGVARGVLESQKLRMGPWLAKTVWWGTSDNFGTYVPYGTLNIAVWIKQGWTLLLAIV